MAKKNQNQSKKNEKSVSSADKQKSRKKQGNKPSFMARFKRFFRDLKAELKRIIWPSKDKMVHSTAVVLSVILAAVLVIWAVDTIVNSVLTAAGFYDPMNIETAATTTVSATDDETETSTTEGTVDVTDPDEEESDNE